MNVTQKLKEYWRRDPFACTLVACAITTVVVKAYEAHSASKGRDAYAKQIDYRIRNNR